MKAGNRKTLFALSLPLLCLASCGGDPVPSSSESREPDSQETSSSEEGLKRVEDNRQLSDAEFTRANLVGYDEFGRFISRGSSSTGKKMGMFYFLWHGSHETGFYDVTKIEKELPGATLDPNAGEISPVEAFHYWSEPLYGYYSSGDPFVLARHAELLTASGVQYLIFDGTNGFEYMNAALSLCEVFQGFADQGFSVPKIAWYSNTHSDNVIDKIYENFYSKGLYEDLWYKVDGKPFTVARTSTWSDEQYTKYSEFFTIKEAQWPDDRPILSEGFPWMDLDYPQNNFDGTISVSSSQAPGLNMADPNSAQSRAYDHTKASESDEDYRMGRNFETQWNTAFNPDPDETGEVENVFLTGWNEWMAVKQNRNGVINFCDQYNEQYSRDMEMENGPLGDCSYLQMSRLGKKWLYGEGEHYLYKTKTINLDQEKDWDEGTTVYLDFAGDARNRDYKKAPIYTDERYVDNSARNDIVSSKVTHDADNLYFRIETAENITLPEEGDQKWMNILLNSFASGPKFAHNFDYRINSSRTSSALAVERYLEDGTWQKIGEAPYRLKGKTLTLALPLSLIGKSESECHISFKVADNVTHGDDIMDYYVSGDSAPIGRLSYEYGY